MNAAWAFILPAIWAGDVACALVAETSGAGSAGRDSSDGELSGSTTIAAILFCRPSWRKSGNRHLPSAFCSQTTFGLASETSLITNRLEKIEKNAIRSPKFFASRKLPVALFDPCAMVMPVSFRPLQGVTLIRPIFKLAPKRWRSSCWILACVPCDCTYRLRARKTTAPKTDNPPNKISARRPNFCTRRRYAGHV